MLVTGFKCLSLVQFDAGLASDQCEPFGLASEFITGILDEACYNLCMC